MFMKLRQPFWTIVLGRQKESTRKALTIMVWKDSITIAGGDNDPVEYLLQVAGLCIQ